MRCAVLPGCLLKLKIEKGIKNMKKTLKLIPAIVMLLVSAILVSTSTYAWFSMNNRVTVTGMKVETRVSSNLFVRSCEYNDHSDNAAGFSSEVVTNLTGMLQPVSTVDGIHFFYVNAADSVTGTGSAKSGAVYHEYVGSGAQAAFNTASGTDGSAVPYVDYVIELKAVNTAQVAQTLRLTELNLTYESAEAPAKDENAYRVAVFMEKYNDTDYANTSNAIESSGTLKSIMKESTATYFTSGKAVVSSSALGDVNQIGQGVQVSVASGATEYYQVIVRLWLEGEDDTCNNDTFVDLHDGKWALDLAFELGTNVDAATTISSAAILVS